MIKHTIVYVLLVSAFTLCSSSSEGQSLTLTNKSYLLRDFRLVVAQEKHIAALIQQSQCRIMHGHKNVQYRDIKIADGIEFEKLFPPSATIIDSGVLLFKLNTIQRRPAWFATNSTANSERASFDKTIVMPGDIIWVLPHDIVP